MSTRSNFDSQRGQSSAQSNSQNQSNLQNQQNTQNSSRSRQSSGIPPEIKEYIDRKFTALEQNLMSEMHKMMREIVKSNKDEVDQLKDSVVDIIMNKDQEVDSKLKNMQLTPFGNNSTALIKQFKGEIITQVKEQVAKEIEPVKSQVKYLMHANIQGEDYLAEWNKSVLGDVKQKLLTGGKSTQRNNFGNSVLGFDEDYND
jgi:hypothetical protein